MEFTWLDCYGNRFTDQQIYQKIVQTRLYSNDQWEIAVGSDSNAYKQDYKFISVLALHRVGYGVDYYYKVSFESKNRFKGNQKLRLFEEVSKSLSMAEEIRLATKIKPVVHIDASPKEAREFSSDFSDQLKGYAISSGYDCMIKPNSWAASCAANKHSR